MRRDHPHESLPQKRRPLPKEVVNYAADPIVAGVCRGLIPVILLFGVYILLNGHLSPAVAFPAGRCWQRR